MGEVPVILRSAVSPNTANEVFGLPPDSRWRNVGEGGKLALGGKFLFGGGALPDRGTPTPTPFIDADCGDAHHRPLPVNTALIVHIPSPFDSPVSYIDHVSHRDVLETILAWIERGARHASDDAKLREILRADVGFRPDYIGFSFVVTGLTLIAGMMVEGALPPDTEKMVCEQVGRIWRLLFGELGDAQLGLVDDPSTDTAADDDDEGAPEDPTRGLYPWIKLEGDYVQFIACVPDMRSTTCFLQRGILWGPATLRAQLTEFYVGRLIVGKLRERMRCRGVKLRLPTLAYREGLLKVVPGPAASTRPSIRLPPGTTVADIEASVPPCIAGILERYKKKGVRLLVEQRILVWPTLFSLVAAAGHSVESFYETIEPRHDRPKTLGEFRSTLKNPARYIVGCAHHSACAACPFTGNVDERSRACLDHLRLDHAARAPIARCTAKLKLAYEEDALCAPFM